MGEEDGFELEGLDVRGKGRIKVPDYRAALDSLEAFGEPVSVEDSRAIVHALRVAIKVSEGPSKGVVEKGKGSLVFRFGAWSVKKVYWAMVEEGMRLS